MRCLCFLLPAIALYAADVRAADPPKFSPAQQEVLKVRQAIREAGNRRDIAAFSRFIADDCIFSDDDGVLRTKADFLAHLRKLPPAYDRGVDARDFVVHLYGDTAVINLRVTVHERFTDADIVSEQRQTETYVKQGGSWLLVARQWGNLPVNFRRPVTVDTSAYKDYVGQYEWRPGDSPEVVSLQDGKLWSLLDGQREEALPLAPDTFFYKDDLGSTQFSRDARGRVTGYVYHRVDGQEIHVRKIK
ncbi:MAG: DUF4440 domain-containing protein [Bryobacteraceae bacterium]|jgi:ketosteroid isomerase-like protein